MSAVLAEPCLCIHCITAGTPCTLPRDTAAECYPFCVECWMMRCLAGYRRQERKLSKGRYDDDFDAH